MHESAASFRRTANAANPIVEALEGRIGTRDPAHEQAAVEKRLSQFPASSASMGGFLRNRYSPSYGIANELNAMEGGPPSTDMHSIVNLVHPDFVQTAQHNLATPND